MAKHIYVVMSNAVAGKDAEYNEWYTNQHLGDVVRVCNCTKATRYRLADMNPPQASDQGYMAIYEVETDDPAEVAAKMTAAFGTPAMPASDALDLTTLKLWFFAEVASVTA